MKILGEEYSLLFCTEEEDPALSEKYAYTDWTNKTIVLNNPLFLPGQSREEEP